MLLILCFVLLALGYAHFTPPWQAPDEPAHYNVVRFIAERHQLPVLQAGDYPAQLVPIAPKSQVTDLAPYRYESHQPPLFYLLELPVYVLTSGNVLAMRSLGVVIGALLLPVTYLCARQVLPGRPWLWLFAAGFAGFIPMNLFIDGSIENDSLADLVMALLLLLCLGIAMGKARSFWAPLLGVSLGLAVLTKVTIALPALVLAAIALWFGAPSWRRFIRDGAIAATAAAVVCGWWLVRNGLIYGWTDLLVQQRQAQVAGGQAQRHGFGLPQLQDFTIGSFHSFWGQFGWMSLPLPNREYTALGLICIGFSIAAVVAIVRRLVFGRVLLTLLATWAAVVAGDLYYNLTFVQNQGRYLFPALAPLAVLAAAGVGACCPRRFDAPVSLVLSILMVAFAAFTLRQGIILPFQT
ncbi:MAG: DUF2142 domain-containing protein [Chloroflexi bacterium]|nr:DUF2142 domain-containing protein [Chloroflexota bacterium]